MDVERWWAGQGSRISSEWFEVALKVSPPNDDPKVVNVVKVVVEKDLRAHNSAQQCYSSRTEPRQENWLMAIGCGALVVPIRAGATSY
mgnify:FL=1